MRSLSASICILAFTATAAFAVEENLTPEEVITGDFETLDVNGDGTLSADEFDLRHVEEGEEDAVTFDDVDADGDGAISSEEYQSFWSAGDGSE